MIGGQGLETRRELRAMEVRQLFRMQLDRKSCGGGRLEDPAHLFGAEADAFAKGVDGVDPSFAGQVRDHPVRDQGDVAVGISSIFRCRGVGPQEGRADTDGAALSQLPGCAQHAALVLNGQAVAGLDLEGGDPFGHQCLESGEGGGHQLGLGRLAGGLHRREDSAARAGNVLVGGSPQAQLELVRPVAPMDEMRVAVDEARRDPPAVTGDGLPRVDGRGLCARTHMGDPTIRGGHDSVLDEPDILAGHRQEPRARPDCVAVHGPASMGDGSLHCPVIMYRHILRLQEIVDGTG